MLNISAQITANAQKIITKAQDGLISPLAKIIGDKLVEASQQEECYNKEKTSFTAVSIITPDDAIYGVLSEFKVDAIKNDIISKSIESLGVQDFVNVMSVRFNSRHPLGDSHDGEFTKAFIIRIKYELEGKTQDFLIEEPNFDGMPLVNILGD